MDGDITVNSNPFVYVYITCTSFVPSYHPLKTVCTFQRSLRIAELKGHLQMIVGTPQTCMELELFSASDMFLQKLDDDEALLGSYPVHYRCRINVVDRRQFVFHSVSKVQTYKRTCDAYDKREDSARTFMTEYHVDQLDKEASAEEKKEDPAAGGISVGRRCKVHVPGKPTVLGTVMYVGKTDFRRGTWVGVKYDKPLGRHNGTVKGKKYFGCQNKYGVFVKPLKVTVGDFPKEE
ncbi:unnamed protein product [Ophioblennius macclurei]